MGLFKTVRNFGLAATTVALTLTALRNPGVLKELPGLVSKTVRGINPAEAQWAGARFGDKFLTLEKNSQEPRPVTPTGNIPPEVVEESQQAVAQSPQAVVTRPQPGQKINAKA